MCDSATVQLIEKYLDNRLNKNEMFTAYDITCDLRNDGNDVYHSDVKKVVHDRFDSYKFPSHYARRQVDVGMPNYPFLYYSIFSNPSSYKPNTQVNINTTMGSAPGNSGNSSIVSKTKNRTKRVFVSSEVLKQLGKRRGDKVFAFPDPVAERVLLKTTDGFMYHSHEYTVDKYNNTKVSQCALEKANIHNKDSYEVTFDPSLRSIVIK